MAKLEGEIAFYGHAMGKCEQCGESFYIIGLG